MCQLLTCWFSFCWCILGRLVEMEFSISSRPEDGRLNGCNGSLFSLSSPLVSPSSKKKNVNIEISWKSRTLKDLYLQYVIFIFFLHAAAPVSSDICFAPRLHVSLVVSKGAAVVSLEVSRSSLSSSLSGQGKEICYTNLVHCTVCSYKYHANCSLLFFR